MKNRRQIVVIAHNIRSTHNVGSIFRTADGMGVKMIWLTGYTPYPKIPGDKRLPHVANKIDKQIAKTALGAEKSVKSEVHEDLLSALGELRNKGYLIYAVEQSAGSIKLPDFKPPDKLALILGREVEGIEPEILEACDGVIEIPMLGKKESFNVAQAAAITLYHCTYA